MKTIEMLSLRFAFGITSEGRVKCLYIEKERIPTVWTVFLIFVITGVFLIFKTLWSLDFPSKIRLYIIDLCNTIIYSNPADLPRWLLLWLWDQLLVSHKCCGGCWGLGANYQMNTMNRNGYSTLMLHYHQQWHLLWSPLRNVNIEPTIKLSNIQ